MNTSRLNVVPYIHKIKDDFNRICLEENDL